MKLFLTLDPDTSPLERAQKACAIGPGVFIPSLPDGKDPDEISLEEASAAESQALESTAALIAQLRSLDVNSKPFFDAYDAWTRQVSEWIHAFGYENVRDFVCKLWPSLLPDWTEIFPRPAGSEKPVFGEGWGVFSSAEVPVKIPAGEPDISTQSAGGGDRTAGKNELTPTSQAGLAWLEDELDQALKLAARLHGTDRDNEVNRLFQGLVVALRDASVLTKDRVKNEVCDALDISKRTYDQILREALMKAASSSGAGASGAMAGFASDWMAIVNQFISDIAPQVYKRWRQEWYLWRPGKGYVIQELEGVVRVVNLWMYNRGLSVTTEATSNFMNALRTYCFIDGKFEAPFWITRPADAKEDEVFAEFSNGLLSLDNYKAGLRKPTHDYFTLTALPYKYDPAATCPSFLGCLDQWHPEEDAKKLLQNWAGYCFEPTQRCQVFLCSIGEAHTGKSVYSKVLVALLGEDNVSNTDLTAFDPANRFGLMPMLGKALNVTGDANDLDRPGEGTLKAITGGDRILVDRKGISPLNIYINAKLLLNANSPPPWRDRSEGIWRRMLVLMWNRVIPETDRVDGLEKWLIANELSGIFNWALEGYHRVKSEGFPVVRGGAVDQAREIVRETVQKEIQFFETCLNFTKEPGWALPCAELTKIYVRWCFKTNNKKALDERKLGMALRKWLRARYPAELAAVEAATTGGNLRFRQSDGKRAWCYAGVWVSDEWKSPEDDTS